MASSVNIRSVALCLPVAAVPLGWQLYRGAAVLPSAYTGRPCDRLAVARVRKGRERVLASQPHPRRQAANLKSTGGG